MNEVPSFVSWTTLVKDHKIKFLNRYSTGGNQLTAGLQGHLSMPGNVDASITSVQYGYGILPLEFNLLFSSVL